MKRSFRIFTVIVAVCLVFSAAAFAAGSNYTKQLTASYVGVQLVVDGKPVTPKDANGNAVDPFIVDGTTYLPVRAVAEALGKSVDWDGDTKTVYIGKKPYSGSDSTDYASMQAEYREVRLLKVGGEYYAFNKSVGDFDSLYLNGGYTTIGDLAFASDVYTSESGTGNVHNRSLALLFPLFHALTEEYVTEESNNPYFKYIINPGREELFGWLGNVAFGIEETVWYSPSESYTPMWVELNGYKLYRFNPYAEYETVGQIMNGQILIQNGIRYYARKTDNPTNAEPCINDVYAAFGIDLTVTIGNYEGFDYICVD